MKLCYPRLTRGDALAIFEMVRDMHAREGRSALTRLVRFDHERKVPVATGRIARPEEISHVRQAVIDDLAPWVEQSRLSEKAKAEFDAALGRSLHQHLNIVPADAAHEGTWSFLTLVVFPDIAALRFPDFHRDRFIGSLRNALRRTWQRYDILGDLRTEGRPLGEDELVGITERTAVVRNRRLARALAIRVQRDNRPGRSFWARELYKRATFHTGVRLLDMLDDNEIGQLVESLGPCFR